MKKRGGPIRKPHFCETFFIFKPSAPGTPPLSSRFGAGGVTRPRPPEDVSSYANSLKLVSNSSRYIALNSSVGHDLLEVPVLVRR